MFSKAWKGGKEVPSHLTFQKAGLLTAYFGSLCVCIVKPVFRSAVKDLTFSINEECETYPMMGSGLTQSHFTTCI